jgi:tripartite-type tricarboxylate transporter receptor subunit TctC
VYDRGFAPPNSSPELMNHKLTRRRIIQMGSAASALVALPGLHAQARYPDRPVRIVVPFAAGAGTDAMGRLLAQKLSELLGGSFVVENRTGASGAIGTQFAAQSPPDGGTLLLIAAPFTTVAAVLSTAGYDPIRSFTPIGMVARGPLLWAANKDLPARSLRELIELARARPGQLNYASAGVGGINHLALEMLKVRTGVAIEHVPYRGIAPATQDLIGGQVQLLTGTVPALLPLVRDGRIKPLAVTSAVRSTVLPDVPSMVESGLDGVDILNFFALAGPHGLPEHIVQTLNEALAKIVQMSDVQARFKAEALEAATGTPKALADFLSRDLESWKQIVAAQNIKLDAL